MDMELPEHEIIIAEKKYDFLNHSADVQLHAWGSTLQESFEQCGMAMFGYMIELEYVTIKKCMKIETTGDDLKSLLFHFLDDLLFSFSNEPNFICKKLEIIEFDLETFEIECLCYGETFESGKHPQGTEINSITYSSIQINHRPDRNHFDICVVIDI